MVAQYADWHVNENDLHARHIWLVSQKISMQKHLEGDPEWYDAKIAGWWVWGMALWIGSDFCSGRGPWVSVECMLQKMEEGNKSVIPGIRRQRPHLTNNLGVKIYGDDLGKHIWELAKRIQNVRVCCGDWSRVVTPALLGTWSPVGVFLDPPYSAEADRTANLYAEDSLSIAHHVRDWCVENGNNPSLRIALCGYQGEHEELSDFGWSYELWHARGGMANIGSGKSGNRFKEIVWFSPYCISARGFGL